MKKLITTCWVLLVFFAAQANDGQYVYTVDLTKIEDDKLKVTLQVPKISTNEIVFYLPKIIPGTYSVADYGRFVSDLQAFDKKGKPLEVVQIDANSWKILTAKKMKKLSYTIEDSYDTKLSGPEIFQPAGTNFEADKNFVINTSGFFGYFDEMKDLPFTFNVVRDKSFYGSTGLIQNKKVLKASLDLEQQAVPNSEVDTYTAVSYDQLVDSPLMYAKPDTAVIQVANTQVLVATYSPNALVNSQQIASAIEPILMAQKEYLGGKLPVDKYAFIFYFTDQPVTSYGALEHSYSSFYYMPEMKIEDMEQQLRDFAAHEFFHIVTPLTVHSQEIHQFDFNDPKMSKHLWLYEGVTEYFAGNVQVKHGLISREQYLGMLQEKIAFSKSRMNDSLAFTDLSKYTLDKYSDQYYNVYQKGALIGMCLDIELLELSNGTYGVRNLLADLSEKYGKDKGFEDDALFGVIETLTFPEIRQFFKQYVENGNPIPYSAYFQKVGVQYSPLQESMELTMGIENAALGVSPEGNQLYIRNKEALNAFGKTLKMENNDVIVAMNDQKLPPLGPQLQQYVDGIMASLEEGKEFSITVLRQNSNGEKEEIILVAENFKVKRTSRHALYFQENISKEQKLLQDAWITP